MKCFLKIFFLVCLIQGVCLFRPLVYCQEKAFEPTIDLAHPQFSELNDDQKLLITEFFTNYCELTKFYENIRIDAEFVPSDNSQKQDAVKYVFRSRDGNHFRMDAIPKEFLHEEDGNGILFVTPKLYSAIERTEPVDDFYVKGVQVDDALDGIADFTHFRFWRAPYSTWFLPIQHCIFAKPGFAEQFKISQLSQKNDGTNDLVTIETQYFQKGQLEIVGTFTFYRNRCWALKETKWEYVPKKEARYSLVEYSGEKKGIPLLSKVTYWYADSNNTTPVDQITKKDVFVCKVHTDPIPYSDFDVQQYVKIGLPEPNHRYLFLRLTLMVLGIVLIVWGLSRALLKK